jgi:hypothetical protein
VVDHLSEKEIQVREARVCLHDTPVESEDVQPSARHLSSIEISALGWREDGAIRDALRRRRRPWR